MRNVGRSSFLPTEGTKRPRTRVSLSNGSAYRFRGESGPNYKNGKNKMVGKTAVDLPEQGTDKKSYKNYEKNFGN